MIEKKLNVDELLLSLTIDAEKFGYKINPDESFAKDLANGLLINQDRYGYMSCPCRLSTGDKTKDIDIICPCDYRDDDINQYGACYCALYVCENVFNAKQIATSVPERRQLAQKTLTHKIFEEPKTVDVSKVADLSKLPYPLWRCKVCGYLCARTNAPEICPICKATNERFERFL